MYVYTKTTSVTVSFFIRDVYIYENKEQKKKFDCKSLRNFIKFIYLFCKAIRSNCLFFIFPFHFFSFSFSPVYFNLEPETKFDASFENIDDEIVVVRCAAYGIAPQPNITLL